MSGAAPSFIEMELRATDTRRHWSPTSQTYAPADVLIRFLAEGWQLSPIVGLEEHWHAGVRRVDVYHFEVSKGEETAVLPVHSNPVVRRLLRDRNLRIVLLQRDDVTASGDS